MAFRVVDPIGLNLFDDDDVVVGRGQSSPDDDVVSGMLISSAESCRRRTMTSSAGCRDRQAKAGDVFERQRQVLSSKGEDRCCCRVAKTDVVVAV